MIGLARSSGLAEKYSAELRSARKEKTNEEI